MKNTTRETTHNNRVVNIFKNETNLTTENFTVLFAKLINTIEKNKYK